MYGTKHLKEAFIRVRNSESRKSRNSESRKPN